jgi:ornithine carbamoyltransferase
MKMSNIFQNNLELLKQLHIDTYNRDFLLTWERTDDELKAVLTVAQLMNDLHKAGISFRAVDTARRS